MVEEYYDEKNPLHPNCRELPTMGNYSAEVWVARVVGIIDYGSGNVGSILNALKKTETDSILSNQRDALLACSHIILPGVGSFSGAMQKLRSKIGLDFVRELADQKPFLGICVGMQALGSTSEEFGSTEEGMGIFPHKVRQLRGAPYLPHVGWNSLIGVSKQSQLLKGLDENEDFYFVHSFVLDAADGFSVASCSYGEEFIAVVERGQTFGVQFHPEKSGPAGVKLLENFARV